MVEISLVDPENLTADLFIGCIGYEHRSLSAFRKTIEKGFDGRSVLFDYQSGELFSYANNRADPLVNQCTLEADFNEFRQRIEAQLMIDKNVSVLLDVTSFDREKIAILLQLLFSMRDRIQEVSICYFPRKFVEPSRSLDIVRSFGPVTPALIGETSSSRDSLALIIGAGYEYGRAVGAIDLLEPSRIYCMTPIGTDPRFEEAIRKNNLDFSFLEENELLQRYDLCRPENLFYELRRIVEFEIQERNVLILPLGPKLFAATAMLVAYILHPAVMVWRHSTASKKSPRSTSDAHASGADIRLAFKFVS